jgi:hypothetical protein
MNKKFQCFWLYFLAKVLLMYFKSQDKLNNYLNTQKITITNMASVIKLLILCLIHAHNKLMFLPGRPFQHCLMFVCRARYLRRSGGT